MDIEEILHRNRDENSFTSRLFESYIIPHLKENNENAKRFIISLKKGFKGCKDILDKKGENCAETINIPEDFEYIDSMLFVEAIDLFSALGKCAEDKTEFDAMVVYRKETERFVLTFEVKCFQSLDEEELLRQKKRLEELTKIYEQENKKVSFIHIILISEHLLNSKTNFFRLTKRNNNLKIALITWRDIKAYIPQNRICDKDLSNYKTISKSNGLGKNIWKLT